MGSFMRVKYFSSVKKTSLKRSQDDDYDYEVDDLSGLHDLTVTSWDSYTEDTGLLDTDGNPILKQVSPNPIGYIWPDPDDDE